MAKLARDTWLPGLAITAVRGWRMVTTYSKASGIDAHEKRLKRSTSPRSEVGVPPSGARILRR